MYVSEENKIISASKEGCLLTSMREGLRVNMIRDVLLILKINCLKDLEMSKYYKP